jgi:DNA polymerase III delta prime subunit
MFYAKLSKIFVMLMPRVSLPHHVFPKGEMFMTNDHIVQYCSNYICSDSNPQFALLIKGKWGCGKTYLVKHLIDELTSEKRIEEREIVSVSLYGVSSIEDLNERMFQALHPVLSSPYVQLAGMLIRSAIKVGANIDINADGKADASISFGGLEKKRKYRLKDIKKRLLIVDDLERCELDSIVIFGFFSDVIINQKLKAIFIGNEEEIKKDDDKLNKNYRQGKEKVIGLEFTVKPELNEAIEQFVVELQLAQYGDMLRETCLSILNTLKYENLRNVRQCFYNLAILLQILPADTKKEYLQDTVRVFILLFLQKNQNKIKEGDTHDAIAAFLKYSLAYDEFLAKKEKSKDYDLMFYLTKIPLEECWEGLIFGGDYSSEKILDNYRRDAAINDPKKLSTLFYILNHWLELDKNAFRANMDSLITEFNDGLYLHPGEIMHFGNILLIFSKMGVIEKTDVEVVDLVTAGIEKHRDRIVAMRDTMAIDHGYGGFAYSDGLEKLGTIRSKILEVNEVNINRKIADELKTLVMSLGKDIKTFVRKILHINGDGTYYGVPVMSIIDVKSLFEKLRQIRIEDQSFVVYALEERYGKKYANSPFDRHYYPDIDAIKQLKDLYYSASGDILYDPQALQTKQIAGRLNDLYEYMIANKKA